MGLIDVILLLLYFTCIISFAYFFNLLKKEDFLYRKYFLKGLMVKMLGGICYAFLYTFYYDYGGDTMAYYNHSSMIYDYIFHDFSAALDYMFKSDLDYSQHKFTHGREMFLKGSSEFFAIIMMSIVNILALDNFFVLTLLFAVFSFVGVWHLFLVIARKYPKLHKEMAISILFVPSVFFWGSGLMKDTIVIGFIGLVIYFFYKAVEKRKQRILSLIIVIASGIIIFNIKAYVIISLSPALAIWALFNLRNRIDSNIFKTFMLPIIVSFLIIVGVFSVQFFGEHSAKYSTKNIMSTAKGMQSWHQVQHHRINGDLGRGSSYTLGDYDESLAGILIMVPASINVTLFRPYPTEITSPIMIFSALESLIILLFSIYVFIGLGFFRILKILNNDAFLLMALLFSLFFAFAVGFTSYNFGALVRYKIPCIPFYLCSLFILQHEARRLKRLNL